MEQLNKENTFDPTPCLKTSPLPILFISFNQSEDTCNYCGAKFSFTVYYDQKYCKNCLTWYTKYLTDDTLYLDIHIVANNSPCNMHEPRSTRFCSTNMRDW